MRKLLLLLPLLLAGCSSDDSNVISSNNVGSQPQTVDNPPQPADPSEGDWIARLTGLPFILNDVVWDGESFIAVGDKGAILTSADGEVWAERASGTDADLNAIAVDGSDIVAVGYDATVLVSTDRGTSWAIKHSMDRVRLSAVVISPWQIVAGGMDQLTGDTFIMRSEDRGESWTVVDSLPQSGHFVTDLIYTNGLYVAATDVFDPHSDARVMVSIDGKDWQEIILREDVAASYAILHDGSQFIAAGSRSTVFASADGYIWTELPTPVDSVDYLSAAWSGSELMVAGGISWFYWWEGTPPFERPTGLSSTDGGATWETVDIGGYYQSRGMAWGNGRFVSVGQPLPNWGEGAIYTSS